jgi:XapX domain-containing protein
MVEILFSFAIGGSVGLGFAFIGVPVPAPPTVAGVAGILGLTIGYMAIQGLRG